MIQHEFGGTGKSAALANNNFFYAKLHHSACAQVTGHQRGIEDGTLVIADSPGVAKAVNFGMGHGVALLYAAVVAAANDFALLDQHRSNGDAALGKTQPGFFNSSEHEFIHN